MQGRHGWSMQKSNLILPIPCRRLPQCVCCTQATTATGTPISTTASKALAFLRDGRPDIPCGLSRQSRIHNSRRPHRNADGARLVMRHINDGILGLWYTGHGGLHSGSASDHEPAASGGTQKQSVSLRHARRLCETFTFDLNHGSIAEQMVSTKPDGGFMGCIAAGGRAVYLDYNRA